MLLKIQFYMIGVLTIACVETIDDVPHLRNASAQLAEGLRRTLLQNNYDYSHSLSLDASRELGPPDPGLHMGLRGLGPVPPPVNGDNYMGDGRMRAEDQDSESDQRLNSTHRAKYRMLKMGDGGRNMKGRQIIEEQDSEGVTLISVDGEPLPEFQLPRSRRQYMIETNPQPVPMVEPAPPPPDHSPPPANINQPPNAAPNFSTLDDTNSDDWNVADFDQNSPGPVAEQDGPSSLTVDQFRNLVLAPVAQETNDDMETVNQTRRLAPDPDPDWMEVPPPSKASVEQDNDRFLMPSDMSQQDYRL